MKNVALVLSMFVTVPAFAQPQEVTRLLSANTEVSSFGAPSTTVKFKYYTGGCNAANHKLTYKLELLSKETQGTAEYSQTHIKAKLHIFEEGGGPCRMAYQIERTVDTGKLFQENAAEFGVSLNTPNAYTTYEIVLPPVITSGTVIP